MVETRKVDTQQKWIQDTQGAFRKPTVGWFGNLRPGRV